MITEDEFSAWQESPITDAVLRACVVMQTDAKDAWVAASWDQENPDPLLLARLRARADAFGDILDLEHDELETILERA